MQYQTLSKLNLLLAISVLFFSLPASAEEPTQKNTTQKVEKAKKLYRVVDENGNVSFSDQPSPGSTEIAIKEVPSIKIKTPKVEFKDLEDQLETRRDPNASYYGVMAFASLTEDGVVRNNGATVTLTANLDPGLSKGHFLKFYIDGQLIKGQQKALSITADKVEYGPHTASFEVVTERGTSVQKTVVVKFNLLHIVRKKARNNGLRAFNIDVPDTLPAPTYDSMTKSDETDK